MQTPGALSVMPNAGTHPNTSENQYTEQIYEQPPRSKFLQITSFRVSYTAFKLVSGTERPRWNGKMTIDNPQVISDYIAEDLAADRLIELTPEVAESLGIHWSPIEIISKKDKPEKWQLIVMLVSMSTPMSIHYASNLQFMTDTFGTQASYPNGAREDGGPSTSLVFLGIELNSVAGELRLPEDRLTRLRQLIAHWRGKKEC